MKKSIDSSIFTILLFAICLASCAQNKSAEKQDLNTKNKAMKNPYYSKTDKKKLQVSDSEWKKVEFSIHLNSMKMFINGERVKIFTPKEKQKKLP
jgi:uncharacterized lipoprotein YehR (DUF1307 family)